MLIYLIIFIVSIAASRIIGCDAKEGIPCANEITPGICLARFSIRLIADNEFCIKKPHLC